MNKDLEQELLKIGYQSDDTPDGFLDKKTRAALKRFQRRNKLQPTDNVDSSVIERLRQAKPLTQYAAGQKIQDCRECPELIVIPPGRFRRDEPWEKQKDQDSAPHVKIGYGFAVGKYEVTVDEYAHFVRETGRKAVKPCRTLQWEWIKVLKKKLAKFEEQEGVSWQAPGFQQSSRDPVVCATWKDAKGFVQWLSEKTGEEYRLLSESEWEYVARGGSAAEESVGRSGTRSL